MIQNNFWLSHKCFALFFFFLFVLCHIYDSWALFNSLRNIFWKSSVSSKQTWTVKLCINLHMYCRTIWHSICSYPLNLHGKCKFDPGRDLKVKLLIAKKDKTAEVFYLALRCLTSRTLSASPRVNGTLRLLQIPTLKIPCSRLPTQPFDPEHCGIGNWRSDALPSDELSSKSRPALAQQCPSASGIPW